MIGSSRANSSSGSGDTTRHSDLQRSGSPQRACKSSSSNSRGEANPASSETAEQADTGHRRGGGAGLSAEELRDLQKADPKRAKRILANRSSAARSKVRKLRYIAELESRSAVLQGQADGLKEELQNLHLDATVLSKENEELYGQAYSLHDQLQSQQEETEHLVAQLNKMHSLCHPALPPSPFATCGSHTRGLAEEPLMSLQIPQHQLLPPDMPPNPSFASIASMFCNPNPVQCSPYSYGNAPPNSRREQQQQQLLLPKTYPTNDLQVTGSGLSCTTQESIRDSDMDPALLELLRMTDISSVVKQELPPQPSLPPLQPLLQGIDDGTDNASGLRLLESLSSQSGSIHAFPGMVSQHSLLTEAGRHRSLSSMSSGYSTSFGYGPYGASPLESYQDKQAVCQGLARWPRHFSDPQSFNRSPFGRPYK